MIVAEILAKSSPRKVINILDENDESYFCGKVKDCPVELYNLEVYDTPQWFVRVHSRSETDIISIPKEKIVSIIETLKRIADLNQAEIENLY